MALRADRRGSKKLRGRDFVGESGAVVGAKELDLRQMHSPALIEITSEPLDAERLEAAVMHSGAGAVCTFTGIVRDNSRGRAVTHLEYEAYPEMARATMQEIANEIAERWPEARTAMAHRTGRLEISEASAIIAVSCSHRDDAIAACDWAITRLKVLVPIWKKEHAADGTYWIEGTNALKLGGQRE